jgi:hypothetical protein
MDLTGKIFEGIASRTNPEIGKFIEEIDGLEGPDIGFIQIGYAFSPDPLTPESYIARGPYTNPNSYKKQMDESVERGWLEKIDKGQYQLSEKGLKTVLNFIKMGDQLFSDLPSLPQAETIRIVTLLTKLVEEAYQLPEPASKPTMEIGVRLNPGEDAAPMLRIRRHLTDLNYYREDAHIAAWQPFYGVDGRVFETLTFLWRDETATPAALSEQLSEYRNYDEDDYASAFEELVTHGWATKEDGKYIISEMGQKIRQEVENRTDDYFARPFAILNKAEIEELKGLLEMLAEVLKPPDDEEEPSE